MFKKATKKIIIYAITHWMIFPFQNDMSIIGQQYSRCTRNPSNRKSDSNVNMCK